MTEEEILERRIELKHQLIVLTEAEIKTLEDKLQELREAKKRRMTYIWRIPLRGGKAGILDRPAAV